MSQLPNIPTSITDIALTVGEQYEQSLLNLSPGDAKTRKSLLFRDMTEWPELGRTAEIATFAANRENYAAFLGMLTHGARVTTTARAFGLLQRKVTEWLHKGVKHIGDYRESCYAWFYMDCFQARGASLVQAEMKAYEDDPIGFIKRMDAGGQFNDLDPIGAEALFRLTEVPTKEQEEDGSIGGDDVMEAFKALAEKGALNLESFASEAKAQAPRPSLEENNNGHS